MKYIIAVFGFFVLLPATADTIRFKNGQTLEGKLVDLGNGKVKVIHRTLEMTFNKNDIATQSQAKTPFEVFGEKLKAAEALEDSAQKGKALWDLSLWAREKGLILDAALAQKKAKAAYGISEDQQAVKPAAYVSPWTTHNGYPALNGWALSGRVHGTPVPPGVPVVYPRVFYHYNQHYLGWGGYTPYRSYAPYGVWGRSYRRSCNYGYGGGLSLFYNKSFKNGFLRISLNH